MVAVVPLLVGLLQLIIFRTFSGCHFRKIPVLLLLKKLWHRLLYPLHICIGQTYKSFFCWYRPYGGHGSCSCGASPIFWCIENRGRHFQNASMPILSRKTWYQLLYPFCICIGRTSQAWFGWSDLCGGRGTTPCRGVSQIPFSEKVAFSKNFPAGFIS